MEPRAYTAAAFRPNGPRLGKPGKRWTLVSKTGKPAMAISGIFRLNISEAVSGKGVVCKP